MMAFSIITRTKFLKRFQVHPNPNSPDRDWRVIFVSRETEKRKLRKQCEYMKWNLVEEVLAGHESIPPAEFKDYRDLDYIFDDDDLAYTVDGDSTSDTSDTHTPDEATAGDDGRELHHDRANKWQVRREWIRQIDQWFESEPSRLKIIDGELYIPEDFTPAHQQQIENMLKRDQTDILILDPDYLIFEGERSDSSKMGRLYAQVDAICRRNGVTLAIVCHNKKRNNSTPQTKQIGTWPDRADTAYAAPIQFARSWVFVNREEEYRATHKHRLLIGYGNSEGDAGFMMAEIREKAESTIFGSDWLDDLAVHETMTRKEYDARQQAIKQEKNDQRERQRDERPEIILDILKDNPDKWFSPNAVGNKYKADGRKIRNGDAKIELDKLYEQKKVERRSLTNGDNTRYEYRYRQPVGTIWNPEDLSPARG
jgi:hypothetical protein